MGGVSQGNGKATIWKDMVCIYGQMEDLMKGNTLMTKSMGTVFISGQMAEDIKVGGQKESNMVWDNILLIKIIK